MGKGILFIIGAAMLGATTLMLTGDRSDFDSKQEQSNYQHKVIARDIAESGFNKALSDLKREMMDVTKEANDVSMSGGSYDIAITDNHYGDLNIVVEGESEGFGHEIVSNVVFMAPFPSAIALSDDEVDFNAFGSDYRVSGHDWRAPSKGGGSRGFTRTAHAVLIDGANANDVLSEIGESRIDGKEGETAVKPGVSKDFYEAIYQEALSHIDYNIAGNEEPEVQYGQLTSALSNSGPGNPKFIRVNGDLNITGSLQGYGMLIVEDGDLTITSSDFDWEGLVLVRKEMVDTVRVNLAVDAKVHGALVGYSMGAGSSGGGTETCIPEFSVANENNVVVAEEYKLKLTVLGAAISYGGSYDMPVTTKFVIDGQTFEPFGNFDQALNGNVNTGNSGTTYVWEPDQVFPANSSVKIYGKSWYKKRSRYSGKKESHWKKYMAKDNANYDSQLKTLADGDRVPNVGGYLGQYSVEEFISNYIDMDAGKATLSDRQAIYLFELGSTNPSSSAHDMQDLVVLADFYKVDSGAQAVTIPSGPVTGSVASSSNPNKVVICHFPPGNPENVQTISISVNALQTHIDHHNDYDGACVPQPVGGSQSGVCAGASGGGTSRIEFTLGNESAVRYSPEALAKLGVDLNTIANASRVVVTKQEGTTSEPEITRSEEPGSTGEGYEQ